MKKRTTRIIANSLAVVVILGFVAVIANSLRISLRSDGIHGPTVLTTDAAGRIYLNIATTLHVLDDSGNLRESIPLAAFGLQGVTLTDLLALPDGRLLIGSSAPPKILACDLPERRCTSFLQPGTHPVSAFKMAWDADRRHLLVVDGERHRVLVYDRDGKLIQESRGGRRGLRLPNTLLLTGGKAGDAVIADTNQHRLVALDAETLSMERREIPLDNSSGSFRRVWPTDFTLTTDQRYWVILDNDLLKHGDVIRFDATGQPLQRLDLPPDWDPIRLRARPHDVLLAGYDSVELVSISLDGAVITPVGDARFRTLLAGVRARHAATARWWQWWIWAAIAPLAVLAGVAAWLDWKSRRPAADTSLAAAAVGLPPLTGKGIYWLEPDPKIVRLWRHSRWLIYVMAVLLFSPAFLIAWFPEFGKSGELVVLLLAGGVAFMAILVTGLNTLSRGRLGITRDQVVLAAAGKPQRHYYPRQLVYSSRFVSSGEITVFLRSGKGPIYDPAEVSGYLEPLLAAARRLNPLQGYIYLLQQGDRLTWVSTLGIACLSGLYLYTEFHLG